ncbi:MAG: AcrB/AcrD/AcrF family protein, partial [Rhodospirillaceae bacterium]
MSLLVVIVVCGAGVVSTYFFLPKLDYLPNGNRNLILGFLVPPPGYNLETTGEIAINFEAEIKPLLAEDGEAVDPNGPSKLRRFFFVVFRGTTIIGAQAADPKRVAELLPLLQR